MPQQRISTNELININDSDLVLADASLDIRKRKVIDRNGRDIGEIDDLFIDRNERRVRLVQVKAGGFLGLGERHFLIPVDAITAVSHTGIPEVHVNVTLEHIIGAPIYDPHLVKAPAQDAFEPYYGYYGFSPYWYPGYSYPSFSTSAMF